MHLINNMRRRSLHVLQSLPSFFVRRISAALFVVFAITAVTTAQTPDEIKNKLPKIAGWSINPAIEVFNPDNLYERINGAAPGYILFDFQELTAIEYTRDGSSSDAPLYITVQIYRHATAEDAFGIYASERPSESNFINVGAEGYQEGSMLNFFVDKLYIKIESPSTDDATVEAVRKIAQDFGHNVNQAPVFPKQLQDFFPATNRIPHGELYIATGFLGHEFLNKVFTAACETDGKKYLLFFLDAGSAEKAKNTLNAYFQFTKQSLKFSEGRLTIKDRFNGNIECLWKDRYIWGIVNDSKAPLKADAILREMSNKF